MVARRVCVTGVTAAVVYLPLVPVVLSRVNLSIATIFIWVRARLAAAVASHTCLPPPVCVIVVKLSEFWVPQPLALIKGCLQVRKECVSSWQSKQCPRFSRRAAPRTEGERRALQRGGLSVLNDAETANTSA